MMGDIRSARRVPTGWWISHDFLGLTPTAQRVLFSLWTAPETPTCGITTIGAATVADRLRVPVRAVHSALAELSQYGFVSLDQDSPVIWLHGYIEIQLGGLPSSNPKWMTSTASAVGNLPETDLVRRFKAHYYIQSDTPSIPYRYPIDGVSNLAPLPVPTSPSDPQEGR